MDHFVISMKILNFYHIKLRITSKKTEAVFLYNSDIITWEPAAALLMRLLFGLAIQNVETALEKISPPHTRTKTHEKKRILKGQYLCILETLTNRDHRSKIPMSFENFLNNPPCQHKPRTGPALPTLTHALKLLQTLLPLQRHFSHPCYDIKTSLGEERLLLHW